MEVKKKLTDEEYQSLFVTSDTHFGHKQEFIYAKRGYASPEAMNTDMINTINKVVGENGILLHLGDFCLNTDRDAYINILRQLRIKELWMIWGNHNNPIQRSYGGTRQQVAAYHGDLLIRYWDDYLTMRHGKRMYVCFHYPIGVWNGMSQGAMHLCGHSHGNYSLSTPENKTHKILDMGWDVHHHPLHVDDINIIMDSKGTNTCHHA
jgi:calcineurin-like phosphoesterase family protein